MYYFSKTIPVDFDRAVDLVKDALKQEGMGVMTEMDLQSAFKHKLDRDFRRYRVLGACHPQVAFDILQIDDKAAVMFPCNVIVQEREAGEVEVSAVDPLAMFLMVHSPKAKEIALYASTMMQRVINHL
ncbi:MAG: hypothetical protein CV045_01570 [Cyanobacteria bacterium M5B4]|nr:DUF302 domain-containing protein [Cyanobacteria bacterium KgW148]PLS69549.1 MAG: hypothetical protein CV045_01570 [Cyanobacteria bacterium M5B4]